MIPEAFLLANRCGFSLPAEYLPDLARMALRDPLLARRLLPVWGVRGMHFLSSVAEYNGLLLGDESVWQEAPTNLRLAWFARMRSVDPSRARAHAEASWNAEGLEFRKSLIDLFFIGVSESDAPFLEDRIQDRSKEIARVALQWSFLLRRGACYEAALSLGDDLLAGTAKHWPEVLDPVVKMVPSWSKGDAGIFLLSQLAPEDIFSGKKRGVVALAEQAARLSKLPEFSRAVIAAAVLHSDLAVLKEAIASGMNAPSAWADAGRFLKPADWNLLAIHLLKKERDLTENLSYAVFLEKAPLLWTPEHARFFFEAYVHYRLDPMSGIHEATDKRVQGMLEKASFSVPPELEGDLSKAWELAANPFMPSSDPINRFFDTLEFRNQLRKLCQRK